MFLAQRYMDHTLLRPIHISKAWAWTMGVILLCGPAHPTIALNQIPSIRFMLQTTPAWGFPHSGTSVQM